MPHSADLRSGYFSLDLNMDWFYQAMSESFMEFDFLPTYTQPGETEEQAIQATIDAFEMHIEEAFHRWTVYKVIGYKKETEDYDMYNNVWEYLFDTAELYSRLNPLVELTHVSDDE